MQVDPAKPYRYEGQVSAAARTGWALGSLVVIGDELEAGGINVGVPSVAGCWLLVEDDADLIAYMHGPCRPRIVLRQIQSHQTTVPSGPPAVRCISTCP